MADSYKSRSRGSYQSSQYLPAQSGHNYPYTNTTQYTFQPATPSSHSYHTTDSPSPYSYRSSSESVSPYPSHPTTTAERATKRHRTSITPEQGAYMQAQWADASAHSGTHSDPHRAHSARHAHSGGGYDAPGYAHPHARRDPHYGQPHPSSGAHGHTSATNPARHAHSQPSSSEYDEDEEERVDHGPTEFPPRTYTGKSKYDPPRKPGKIPGSAMDYLPILEARFDRLETAIDRYVDYRGQRALSNSILPGMGASDGSLSRESYSSSSRHSFSTSRR